MPVKMIISVSRSVPSSRHILPIASCISMDQITVNIEWDSAYNGDEILLIGESGEAAITVEDLEK
mgnify:CR=1 FL=1